MEDSTPEEFLNQVSFAVNLSKLLKVDEFYHYNSKHDYLPVLVEIIKDEKNDKLAEIISANVVQGQGQQINYKYIFQVWNKDGDKVYQELLIGKPKIVNVFSEAVLFMKDSLDVTQNRDKEVTVLIFSQDEQKNLIVYKKELPNFFGIGGEQVFYLGLCGNKIYQATKEKILYIQDEMPQRTLARKRNAQEELKVQAAEPQDWYIRKGLDIGYLSTQYSDQFQKINSSAPFQTNIQNMDSEQNQYLPTQFEKFGSAQNRSQQLKPVNLELNAEFKLRCIIEHPDESRKNKSLLLFVDEGSIILPIELEVNTGKFSYYVEPKRKVSKPLQQEQSVIDFKFYINEDTMFGVSRLSDQEADIYYNYSICHSSNSISENQTALTKNVKYEDILITPNEIILRQKDASPPEFQDGQIMKVERSIFSVTRLNFSYKSRIGFDVADNQQMDEYTWNIQKNLFISKYYKQFKQMSFIDTKFIVAFSNILAFYDLSGKAWLNEFIVLRSNIDYLIRHTCQNDNGENIPMIVVITESKELFYLSRETELLKQGVQKEEKKNSKKNVVNKPLQKARDIQNLKRNSLNWRYTPEKRFILPGNVIWVSIDKYEDNVQLLGLNTQSGPVVIALTPKEINVIENHQDQLIQGDQLIKFLSYQQQERFIVFNKSQMKIKFFEITRTEITKQRTSQINVKDTQKQQNDDSTELKTYCLDIKLQKQVMVNLTNEDNDFSEFRLGMKVKTTVDDEEKDFIILSTQKHFFIFDYSNPRTVRKIKSLEHEKILMVDQRYFYALLNRNEKKEQGLYYLTLDSFIKEQKDEDKDSAVSTFKLRDAACYQCNFLELFKQEARLVYLSDAETAQIVPILHRNQINFLGMKKRNLYLGFRRINQKLIGLDKQGDLHCWDITNGLIMKNSNSSEERVSKDEKGAKKKEFENYVVYQSRPDDITYKMDWYSDTLLLINLTEEINQVAQTPENYFELRKTQKISINSSTYIEQQKYGFFHFKVIEINEIAGKPEYKETLSFYHYLPKNENKQGDNGLPSEQNNVDPLAIKPQIYISKDKKRMLEKYPDNKVFLYIAAQVDKSNAQLSQTQIKWMFVTKLDDFSHDISGFSYHNYLFNPNLTSYLDYDASMNKYKIVQLNFNEANQELRDEIIYIDVGYMKPKPDEPKNIARKFRWVTDDTFKVINDHGFEMKAKIVPETFSRKGLCKKVYNSRIKIIGQSKIPMLNLSNRIWDAQEMNFHFYFDYHLDNDNDEFDLSTTYHRLLKLYQNYFSSCYTDNLSVDELKSSLQIIDFGRKQCQEQPAIFQTYSFIHWRLSEVLKDSEQGLNILEEMAIEEAKVLCLNIFPNGQNVLHKICNKIHLVKELYSKIQDYNADKKNPQEHFYIPFLKDFPKIQEGEKDVQEGQSPLHICLKDNNIQIVDLFLSQLKFDGIDNHSRAIMDILPELFDHKLESLKGYFDSRLKKTGMLDTFKSDKDLKTNKHLSYSQCSAYLWPNMLKIQKDLCELDPTVREVENFDEILNESNEADQIQSKIKDTEIQIIDIPNVHDPYSKDGIKFFSKLSKVDDIQFFDSVVIQKLIDYQWPLSKSNIKAFLLQTFCIYLAFFVVYSNVLNGQIEISENVKLARYAFIIIILWMSACFLLFEIYQIARLRTDYFKSFWNFNDILSSSFAIITVSFHLKNYLNEDYEIPAIIVTIHSFASLCLWIKFLYFLRVFRPTAYLINALSQVVWDMKVFLCIFFIVNVSFGEAFLRLSEMREESSFIPNYAYSLIYSFRLSLGDTDTDAFDANLQPVTIWFIFVFCALYTNVVMLNLLIAIISKSFENVSDNENQAHYQERAKMIYENSFLVYLSTSLSHIKEVAKYVQQEPPINQRPVTYLIDGQYSKSSAEEVEEPKKEDDKIVNLEAFSKAYNTLFKTKISLREPQKTATSQQQILSSVQQVQQEGSRPFLGDKVELPSLDIVSSSQPTQVQVVSIGNPSSANLNQVLPQYLQSETNDLKVKLDTILSVLGKLQVPGNNQNLAQKQSQNLNISQNVRQSQNFTQSPQIQNKIQTASQQKQVAE